MTVSQLFATIDHDTVMVTELKFNSVPVVILTGENIFNTLYNNSKTLNNTDDIYFRSSNFNSKIHPYKDIYNLSKDNINKLSTIFIDDIFKLDSNIFNHLCTILNNTNLFIVGITNTVPSSKSWVVPYKHEYPELWL